MVETQGRAEMSLLGDVSFPISVVVSHGNALSIGLDVLASGPLERALDSSRSSSEPFRDLLLCHRGRTGLTQRDLAARLGAGRRTVQDWAAGVNYPTAERLKAMIQVLLEAGGLTVGREAAEAQQVRSSRSAGCRPSSVHTMSRVLSPRATVIPLDRR
jgi:hypothetical protein